MVLNKASEIDGCPETAQGPMVSVGMPVYNGEKTLREAIESVLCQTFKGFELIISDNASTDATAAICQEYGARDSRIRYVCNVKNIGGADNYNAVFHLAKGHYFNWLSCDDVMMPRFLETCVAALEANPQAVLAYSRAIMIDISGHKLFGYEGALDSAPWSTRPSKRYRRLLREISRNHSSITIPVYIFGVVRTEVMARTHLQRYYLGQDDNLVAEIILAGEIREVPEILRLIRYHPGGFSWLPTWSSKHLQRWYRPEEKSAIMRIFRLGWRHRVEYFRIVLTADASLWEKTLMTLENLRAILQRLVTKVHWRLKRIKQSELAPWQPY